MSPFLNQFHSSGTRYKLERNIRRDAQFASVMKVGRRYLKTHLLVTRGKILVNVVQTSGRTTLGCIVKISNVRSVVKRRSKSAIDVTGVGAKLDTEVAGVS